MKGRLLAVLAALALLAAGVGLRVVRWRDWPPGPWVDEAYALRAARLVAADPQAPLFGTSPLEPPEAGFVNHWPANLYLRLVALLDRAAGGGIASFRLVSIGPAVLLLLCGFLLAREATRGDPLGFAVAATALATSAWLLTTGRWGWDVPATSATVVLSVWAALAAARRRSAPLAVAAGALLGLSQYGYAAARPVLALPALLLGAALVSRRALRTPRASNAAGGDVPLRRPGEAARRAGLALAAALLVAAPLVLHFLAHPERALARAREVSVASLPPGEALRGVARNLASYAALFLVRGDANERHGDPSRPVLPPLFGGLALAGAASAARRGGPGRLLGAAAALVLLAGVTTAPSEGGNAYRIALAAPFLLVLAGHGAGRLVTLMPQGRRRAVLGVLGVAVVVTAAGEVDAFVSWASSPQLRGAFGGPERELADALALERGPGRAETVVGTEAVRNPFVVEALLSDPGSGGIPAIRLAAALAPLRFRPAGDLLWADRADPVRDREAEALGARRVASGPGVGSFPGWSLFRLDAAAARRLAEQSLGRSVRLPSPGQGRLLAREDGLYTLSARGGLDVTLDGAVVFDARRRPSGEVTVHLARGPHDLAVVRRVAGGHLAVRGPDGYLLAQD